ncbi:MAG: ABC transporter permease, partial [Rubripirellula sp.]
HAKPVESEEDVEDNIVDEAIDAEAANDAAVEDIEDIEDIEENVKEGNADSSDDADQGAEGNQGASDDSAASPALTHGVRLVQVNESEDEAGTATTGTSDGNQKPDQYRLLSIPEREVTSILVRNGNIMFAPAMQNAINEGIQAQAAAPIGEINKLMNLIVGPLLKALLAITLITCVVAAVGILVSIYNSMNDRRRDIAVMRALGARRTTVTAIIVCESFLVALIGAVAGWILAHGAIALYSGQIEEQTGVQVGFFTTSTYELLVLPLVMCLALLAALLPAFSAYRTDVGSNLSA